MNDMIKINEKGQAVAPTTKRIDSHAFDRITHTEIRWLGNGGAMINSRGTILMIDPLLEGFDMPLMIDMPILPEEVTSLDAVLITHIDNDHFSVMTCLDLMPKCVSFHAPQYVAKEMRKKGIAGIGHDIHDKFNIHDVKIKMTLAKHNWQSEIEKYQYRVWKEEDYCGYYIETKDGTIWMPGDSRLLDEHLKMPQPDVILFDFSDNNWHITLDGAVKLANTYPDSELLCIHWGCVDAPDMSPFNGNPNDLFERIDHPERIRILAPGESLLLKGNKS